MTDVERLILENQKMLLHGMRLLMHKFVNEQQFRTMQDAMFRTHDALDADARERHAKQGPSPEYRKLLDASDLRDL
jgi:hypothetical protein